MRFHLQKWLGLGLCLVVLQGVVACVPKAVTAGTFQRVGDGPVVARGAAGSWDGARMDPGAVVAHGGRFHMFYNAYARWPGSVDVGYAVSEDGVNWVKPSSEPVLRTAEVPYAEVAAVVTSALVEGDGTWVLYFHVWQTRNASLGNGFIGRATAVSPAGPWVVDPQPVLRMGDSEDWDGGQVSQASVVKTSQEYRMYYTGADRRGFMRIGLATSPDGITWRKHDDPATGAAPYAHSDPLLVPDPNAWDSAGVYQARVASAEGGWMMAFKSFGLFPQNNAIGLATSPDGLHWEKAEDNPALLPGIIPGARAFNQPSLLRVDGAYWLYAESLTLTHSLGVGLVQHRGRLP